MTLIDTANYMPPVVTPTRPFSLHDRCDVCRFQSYFVATKTVDGVYRELTLCKHHGEEHLTALDFEGWYVFDYREHLTPPPIVDNT